MHPADALNGASQTRVDAGPWDSQPAARLTTAPPPSAVAPARSAPLRRRGEIRYGVALAMVGLFTLLRMPLRDLLGNSVPFILYFPAVMIAGWFGGFGPGVFATVVSGYAAKTWLFEPYGHFEIGDWGSAFRLLLFLGSGLLMSYLCGRLHDRTGELENERDLLEAKVRERTRHLERALSDMEAFSYTVSHDLRAPMRTIHGFTEILLEEHAGTLPPDAKSHLDRIRAAASRLDQMTADLLDLAKVSGAAAELRALALRDIVAGVVENSPHRAPAVCIDYSQCRHIALAHPMLLQQVLQNLLENAVKFVAPGSTPTIRIWTESRSEIVRLWFADNGIGIAPADQQRLFKIFERVAPQDYAGTGIGLAIIERAVAKMNGHVGVESELGAGSRFWIDLAAA
jgi:signal transduction histidine kinase